MINNIYMRILSFRVSKGWDLFVLVAMIQRSQTNDYNVWFAIGKTGLKTSINTTSMHASQP